MTKRLLLLLNVTLLLIFVLSAWHALDWWKTHHFDTVIGEATIGCEESVGSEAYYLATVCRAVTIAKGGLSSNPAQTAMIVSRTAPTLDVGWPNDLDVSPQGDIRDCGGASFEISISQGRIAVSSPNLFAYYFY
jgi:hypothetical protein